MRNATVAVKEWDGEVVFLHEVRKGTADRSYGVQVAKLAGLPPRVVERAQTVLTALESGEVTGKRTDLFDDLPLFSAERAAPAAALPATRSEVETRLRDSRPDELSPRAALDLVYELKSLAGEA